MHVCLPHAAAEKLIGGLPAGVTATVWDGSEQLPADAADVEALICPMIPGATERLQMAFDAMPKVRFVQALFAGVEWIEPILPAGVMLSNTGSANAKPVAEWVVSTLLSHLRELPRFAASQRNHEWDRALTPTLAAKRVTILGNGPIAQALKAMLLPFGAEVRVFARTAREGVEAIADLGSALPDTDVLVVLVPQNDQTIGLVDAAVLAALPDGAIVMNAARGPVVSTGALLAELNAKRIHAILDVTDPEPLPSDHPLWDAPNCVITPHVAGATNRYFDNIYPLVRTQLDRLVAGEEPQFRLR